MNAAKNPPGELLPLRARRSAVAGVAWPIAMLALAAATLVGCASGPSPAPRPSGSAVPPGAVASPAGARIAELAASYVGTPYRYGGQSPVGFDCSGLVWYVHRELGLAVPRTAAQQRSAVQPVRRDDLRPGDLVFFYTPQDHVGIYLGGGEFVHAPSTGKRVERAKLDAPFFILGFAGAGRFAQ